MKCEKHKNQQVGINLKNIAENECEDCFVERISQPKCLGCNTLPKDNPFHTCHKPEKCPNCDKEYQRGFEDGKQTQIKVKDIYVKDN